MNRANSTDDILAAMARYGGSFVKALAKCYWVADSENRQRIERAFATEFDKYDAFATDLKSSLGVTKLF